MIRALIILTRWNGYDIGKYFFADDAFYYLKIAQNVVLGRGSTFDGQFPTNGYHPLWELCCIVLHAIWPQAGARMVSLVYAVQIGLLLTAAVYLYRALRGTQALAASLTVVLLALNTVSGTILVDGMESGLTFTLLCVFAYIAATRAEHFFDLRDAGYCARIGLLLIGFALVRLEAALFAALFVIEALQRSRRERGLQLLRSLQLSTALGIAGALYLTFNLSIAGVPVPVSGLVKAMWVLPAEQFRGLFWDEFSWFVGPLRLQQSLERPALSVLLGVALCWGLYRFQRDARRRNQHGLLLLAGGCIILIAYNLAFARQGFKWYGWPALMLGTLGSFGLLTWALSEISLAHPRTTSAALAAFAIAYGAGTSYRVATRAYDTLYDWTTAPSLMDDALHFIQTEVPPRASLAGDSVGLLSYITGRDIMNVEGLVADCDYYAALKSGDNHALLRERGVDWLMLVNFNRKYTLDCARGPQWSFIEETYHEGQPRPNVGHVQFSKLDYSQCDTSLSAATHADPTPK